MQTIFFTHRAHTVKITLSAQRITKTVTKLNSGVGTNHVGREGQNAEVFTADDNKPLAHSIKGHSEEVAVA